jgi:hypothetical protein
MVRTGSAVEFLQKKLRDQNLRNQSAVATGANLKKGK